MKEILIFVLLACLMMLAGCPLIVITPDFRVYEHAGSALPKSISQVRIEDKVIKSGDWIRATTTDGKIHEFSFMGLTSETLEGGDTSLMLSRIKHLEVFPLLYGNREKLNRSYDLPTATHLSLLDDTAFENRSIKYVGIKRQNMDLTLDNGTLVSNFEPKYEDKMFVGKASVLTKDDHLHHGEDMKLPLSRVVRIYTHRCGIGFYWECIYDVFYNWRTIKTKNRDMLEKNQLLQKGDWVTTRLTNGKIQEFQYRNLEGNLMIGGDSSVAIDDIESMEIYLIHALELVAVQGARAKKGAVDPIGYQLHFKRGMMTPEPAMP